MTLRIVDTCPACGSASFNKNDKCYSCGHNPKANCASCDYALDRRGRCAKCFNVDPDSLERLKWADIVWTVCPDHGALEAGSKENHYRAEWKTVNPKDKRKKDTHHEWRYRCAACAKERGWQGWRTAERAETFRDRIMIPAEVYQPLIDAKLAAWRALS